MNRRSIRWQLPLSYAAIALLAALALGLVLLFALNQYYNQLESEFLLKNGASIDAVLSSFPLEDLPPDRLTAQVKSLSIFSQVRIQVVDSQGNMLADSGSPAGEDSPVFFFSLPINANNITAAPSGGLQTYTVILNPGLGIRFATSQSRVRVEPQPGTDNGSTSAGAVESATPGPGQKPPLPSGDGASSPVAIASSMKIVQPFSRSVSSAQAEIPLNDSSGNRFGSLILSEGPAYSRQIVAIVALAWGGAAILAMILAALAGYFVSRRISQPVTAMAKATTRMAEGDLTVRAPAAEILELGQLSSAFNHMADRIEETILALRRFAADAAHEMKTPLTALRTNLDLAQNESDPERLGTYLKRANDQVLQLNRLVGELLDLSRLESGTHPAVEEQLDLKELVRSTSEVYAARAEQSGLTFNLELPGQPVYLLGRQIQLELAISNLLDNALKFTRPEGWVLAELTLERDHAVFTVEDDGIGIPPEDLPGVFNRFHRASNARSRQGSGLGLAIVNAVAQAHQGRVSAENRPEGGTKFTLRLPIGGKPRAGL